jgi:hypothetical protein
MINFLTFKIQNFQTTSDREKTQIKAVGPKKSYKNL